MFPLDADDLAAPGALAHMASKLESAPGAGACFGDYLEFGHHDRLCRVPERLDPYRLAFRNEFPVTALFRRDVLEEVGGWEDIGRWPGYEDWHLWLTLAESGYPGVHAGAGFVTYRRLLREDSMLSTSRDHHKELYRNLRERHPVVFSSLGELRRKSSLGPFSRLAYPVVFGARRRTRWEKALKSKIYSLRSKG